MVVAAGCAAVAHGVFSLVGGVIKSTDRLGRDVVFRGDFAAIYSWCLFLAGVSLVVAGVAAFIRERRGGPWEAV